MIRFATAGLVTAAHRSLRWMKPFSIIHPMVAVGRKLAAEVKIWVKLTAARELWLAVLSCAVEVDALLQMMRKNGMGCWWA